MAGAKNSSLAAAKNAKSNEFYTQLADIERELKHYRKHFKGKTVYLNWAAQRVSNFFHYFSYNFETLGLKKLIATCYMNQDVDLFSTGAADRPSTSSTKATRMAAVCPICGKTFTYEEMAGDHIAPWSKGGKTIPANLQMLCSFDNNSKGNK